MWWRIIGRVRFGQRRGVERERGQPFEHGEIIDFGAQLPARVVDAGQRGRDEFAV